MSMINDFLGISLKLGKEDEFKGIPFNWLIAISPNAGMIAVLIENNCLA